MDIVPLCEPWPATWCCDTSTLNPAVTGVALQAASETLWELSGHQYGSCEVLVRPCRRQCAGPSMSSWWWDTQTWPAYDRYAPAWLDIACGSCAGSCSCKAVSEVRLPGVVQGITSVLIDGVELPASGYALYDGTTLVKTEGQWPLCQDWTVPVSGIGAWSITAVYGRPVGALGQLAVGELACEIAKACTGGDCRLPANVQSIVRAGVTQNFVDPTELIRAGLTGLRLVDQFLNAVNPHRIRAGARIWDPDDMSSTRVPAGVSPGPTGDIDGGTPGSPGAGVLDGGGP